MSTAVWIAMIGLILVAAAVIVVSVVFFYRFAIARGKKKLIVADEEYEGVVWKKEEEWLVEHHPVEIYCKADDGLRLSAFYVAAEIPTVKTAIIVHGYSSNGWDMSSFARLYHNLGFNVLMPDNRGHGQSEGNYIGFGWHDRKDYMKWIEAMIERNGEHSQIVLHGVSMGGATVLMASGEPLPVQVKGIVADCAYTSIKDILTYQMKQMFRLPAFPLLPLVSLATKLRAGYFFGEGSAIEQVRKSHTPTLFIHGEADTFVPTEMVYRLFNAATCEKELLTIPNAKHANAFFTDEHKYVDHLRSFLGRLAL